MGNNGSVDTLQTVGHQVIIWTNTDLLSITPQDQIWVRKLTLFNEQNQVKNVLYEWPPTTTTTLYSVWYTVWWNVSRMQKKCNKKMPRWYFEYTYNMNSNFTNLHHPFTNLYQCNMTSFVQNTPEATIVESHFMENLFYNKSCSFIEVLFNVKATQTPCAV